MADFDIRDQIAENMRFYGDMRFKQLTLLLAWLTIVGAGISQFGDVRLLRGIELKLILAIASMLVTAVLWIMEIRSSIYWVAHREAYPDLWPRPRKIAMSWLNASNAVLVLYVIIYSFWQWCAYEWGTGCVVKFVGALVGIVLLAYSILSYWHLWTYGKPESKGN